MTRVVLAALITLIVVAPVDAGAGRASDNFRIENDRVIGADIGDNVHTSFPAYQEERRRSAPAGSANPLDLNVIIGITLGILGAAAAVGLPFYERRRRMRRRGGVS